MDKKDFSKTDIGKKVKMEIELEQKGLMGILKKAGILTREVEGEITDVQDKYLMFKETLPKTGTVVDGLISKFNAEYKIKYDKIKNKNYLP